MLQCLFKIFSHRKAVYSTFSHCKKCTVLSPHFHHCTTPFSSPVNPRHNQMLSSSEPSLNLYPSLLPDCCHTHSPSSSHFHSLWRIWALDFAHSSLICCHFLVSITLSSPCLPEKCKLLLQLKWLLDPFLLFLGVTVLRIMFLISFSLYNIFWGIQSVDGYSTWQ